LVWPLLRRNLRVNTHRSLHSSCRFFFSSFFFLLRTSRLGVNFNLLQDSVISPRSCTAPLPPSLPFFTSYLNLLDPPPPTKACWTPPRSGCIMPPPRRLFFSHCVSLFLEDGAVFHRELCCFFFGSLFGFLCVFSPQAKENGRTVFVPIPPIGQTGFLPPSGTYSKRSCGRTLGWPCLRS